MKLLLDTHIFVAWARGQLNESFPQFFGMIEADETMPVLSVASIWEIAIKVDLGKLDAGIDPPMIQKFCENSQIQVLAINSEHATARLSVEPATRDPFDRMLLAQCQVEGMKLVTVDRLLTNHPLAAKV